MKKIIFAILSTWTHITANAMAEKIDCTQFDKVSAKYLECSVKFSVELTKPVNFMQDLIFDKSSPQAFLA